jgi:hypothetical protein
MSTKTHERVDLRALRRKIDDIRIDLDTTGDAFLRAFDSYLTAADYQDETLMRSAREDVKAVLGDVLVESIEKAVSGTTEGLELLRQFANQFEGSVVEPDEQFDNLGRSFSNVVRTALTGLVRLRDVPLMVVRKHGVEVPNAAKLDEHIAHWEAVKANLIDCWPWTDAPIPLPPVDREMVARSRAALEAGEKGEDINALIERLRSE